MSIWTGSLAKLVAGAPRPEPRPEAKPEADPSGRSARPRRRDRMGHVGPRAGARNER